MQTHLVRATYVSPALCTQCKRAVIRKCRAGVLGCSIWSLIDTFALNVIKLEDVHHARMLVAIWLKRLLEAFMFPGEERKCIFWSNKRIFGKKKGTIVALLFRQTQL